MDSEREAYLREADEAIFGVRPGSYLKEKRREAALARADLPVVVYSMSVDDVVGDRERAKSGDLTRDEFDKLVEGRHGLVLHVLAENTLLDVEWLKSLAQTCGPIKLVEEPKSRLPDLLENPDLMRALCDLCRLCEVGVKENGFFWEEVLRSDEWVNHIQFSELYIQLLLKICHTLLEKGFLKESESPSLLGELSSLKVSNRPMRDAVALERSRTVLRHYFGKGVQGA